MERWKHWIWPTGRLARGPYWIALLSLFAASWLLHLFIVSTAMTVRSQFSFFVSALLGTEAIVFWLLIVVLARRLHDIGRTGWWLVVPFAVLTASLALTEPAWATSLGLSNTLLAVATVVGAVAYGGSIIALGCLRGAPGPNQFGPRPGTG